MIRLRAADAAQWDALLDAAAYEENVNAEAHLIHPAGRPADRWPHTASAHGRPHVS